jgi:predicted transglutaminase-like cysteine proteinase
MRSKARSDLLYEAGDLSWTDNNVNLVALAMFCCLTVFLFFLIGCNCVRSKTEEFLPTATLNLPVIEVRDEFLPYKEFCQRNPGECDMSGPTIIELTPKMKSLLSEVNTSVNLEIRFALDKDQYNKEEFWTYPRSDLGDCEDIALEKRSRLTKLGFPRGALRMAIGFHKKTLTSHALLLVKTTEGKYVMDRITNQISLWYQTPYNFESQERTDGKWERFDQNIWTFY